MISGCRLNAQGGIWVETKGKLFLCRATLNEPVPCVDMATGAATTFAALGEGK